jgi:hypothetical protein
MIKVLFIVLASIIYYSITFMLQFGYIEPKLAVAASQVNWSQHRRLSLQLLVYDLRHILTQSFWKTYEAGALGIVDVTEADFFSQLNLLLDIETGLTVGSERFGTAAPSAFEVDQINLMSTNACRGLNGADINLPGCADFDGGTLAISGMHAGVLKFAETARISYALINATLQDPSGTPAATQLNPGGTPPYNVTRAIAYMNVLAASFASPPMKLLLNASELYLDEALSRSGKLYEASVTDIIANYATARIALLIVFCVQSLFMYLNFYNPMCWQLDADQKRTSAMLLFIPVEIIESLPTVRDFVQKLDSRTV